MLVGGRIEPVAVSARWWETMSSAPGMGSSIVHGAIFVTIYPVPISGVTVFTFSLAREVRRRPIPRASWGAIRTIDISGGVHGQLELGHAPHMLCRRCSNVPVDPPNHGIRTHSQEVSVG